MPNVYNLKLVYIFFPSKGGESVINFLSKQHEKVKQEKRLFIYGKEAVHFMTEVGAASVSRS